METVSLASGAMLMQAPPPLGIGVGWKHRRGAGYLTQHMRSGNGGGRGCRLRLRVGSGKIAGGRFSQLL